MGKARTVGCIKVDGSCCLGLLRSNRVRAVCGLAESWGRQRRLITQEGWGGERRILGRVGVNPQRTRDQPLARRREEDPREYQQGGG